MTFGELSKWYKRAKGFERAGLLKRSDWMNPRVLLSESYRKELLEKILDRAEILGGRKCENRKGGENDARRL